MKVLVNRKCGSVTKGGLYAHCGRSPYGTLWPFTAVVFPILAEIANPRQQQLVNVPFTLENCLGLLTEHGTQKWGLPVWGLADQWGTKFYPTPWDVIDEIEKDGVNRKMSPSLVKNIMTTQTFPLPLLVMHKYGFVIFEEENRWSSNYRPWLEGVYPEDAPLWKGMGHINYPNNLDHPFLGFYKEWHICKKGRERHGFPSSVGARVMPGVIGLTVITSMYYVLKDNEVTVPEQWAELGVLPAIGEDDERTQNEN